LRFRGSEVQRFKVQRFRVQGSEVQACPGATECDYKIVLAFYGYDVRSSHLVIPGLGQGFKVQGSRFKVQGSRFRVDGFVKSLKTAFSVFPAKAGIQYFQMVLDACLRRHDGVSYFLRGLSGVEVRGSGV
jgi:hypothetical protein